MDEQQQFRHEKYMTGAELPGDVSSGIHRVVVSNVSPTDTIVNIKTWEYSHAARRLRFKSSANASSKSAANCAQPCVSTVSIRGAHSLQCLHDYAPAIKATQTSLHSSPPCGLAH